MNLTTSWDGNTSPLQLAPRLNPFQPIGRSPPPPQSGHLPYNILYVTFSCLVDIFMQSDFFPRFAEMDILPDIQALFKRPIRKGLLGPEPVSSSLPSRMLFVCVDFILVARRRIQADSERLRKRALCRWGGSSGKAALDIRLMSGYITSCQRFESS